MTVLCIACSNAVSQVVKSMTFIVFWSTIISDGENLSTQTVICRFKFVLKIIWAIKQVVLNISSYNICSLVTVASKKAIIYYAVGILITVEFLTRECHSVILILSWKNCDGIINISWWIVPHLTTSISLVILPVFVWWVSKLCLQNQKYEFNASLLLRQLT